MLDVGWATLNVAQQAGLIIWLLVFSLFIGRVTLISADRRWPLPLAIFLALLLGCGGAVALVLLLGNVPR